MYFNFSPCTILVNFDVFQGKYFGGFFYKNICFSKTILKMLCKIEKYLKQKNTFNPHTLLMQQGLHFLYHILRILIVHNSLGSHVSCKLLADK